jgi:hypothetical protein
MGEWAAGKKWVRCMQGLCCVTMLPDRVDDSFTSTIRLYLSPSQLCLIKRMSNFKVTYLNVVDSYSKFF